MDRSLLLFERIILESLVRSKKTLDELAEDVSIEKEMLQKIIEMLISGGVIVENQSKYNLNYLKMVQ